MARLPSVTSKRTASWSPRCKRAGLDQPAEPDAACRAATFFSTTSVGELKNTIESLQRAQHQHGRERQHAEARADQNQAPLLARHPYFEPQSLDRLG